MHKAQPDGSNSLMCLFCHCESVLPRFKDPLCRSKWTLQDLGLVDSSHSSAENVLHLTTGHLQVTSEDNFWSTMLELQNSMQVLPRPVDVHSFLTVVVFQGVSPK